MTTATVDQKKGPRNSEITALAKDLLPPNPSGSYKGPDIKALGQFLGFSTLLKNGKDPTIAPEVCFEAARSMLVILKDGWASPEHKVQIVDHICNAINWFNKDTWSQLSKAEQDSFFILREGALEKISGFWKCDIPQEMLQRRLAQFKSSYVELSSEQILGLFSSERRIHPQTRFVVQMLLTLNDNFNQAQMTPGALSLAAEALIVRAYRLTSPDKPKAEAITFYQGCQLIELARKAYSFLGQGVSAENPKVDFGNRAYRDEALMEASFRIGEYLSNFGRRDLRPQAVIDFERLKIELGKVFQDFPIVYPPPS